jgi:hypothetical protein
LPEKHSRRDTNHQDQEVGVASKARVYRREAQKVLSELGEAELRVARDFLEYLQAKKPDAATREILESPNLMADIRAGLADRRAGRQGRFKPWHKMRLKSV